MIPPETEVKNPIADEQSIAPPVQLTLGIVILEFALILVVFILHGARPVPDVNEAYYIAKAIHFWNPGWAGGDPFLQSADSHWFFCMAFGWLSLFVTPVAMAWIGRIVTWTLLAWSWRRLSWAVVPRRWFAPLTAALFLIFLDSCNLAGEWVVGGVEGKGFAYVLVLLGLEALVRGRWRAVWVLLGAASAFHVLVGGWAVVATGMVWLMIGNENRPGLRQILPSLALGGLISLLGLVPALMLNYSVDGVNVEEMTVEQASPEEIQAEQERKKKATVERANRIYVYLRLPHHLVPTKMPWTMWLRFLLLIGLWRVVARLNSESLPCRTIQLFVTSSLALAGVGLAIIYFAGDNEYWAAGWLRFYWFRLSDFAIPLGTALGLPWLLIYAYEDAIEAFAESSKPIAPRVWHRRITCSCIVILAVALLVQFAFRLNPQVDRAWDYCVALIGVILAVWVAGRVVFDLSSVSLPIRRDWASWRLTVGIVLLILLPCGYVIQNGIARSRPVIPRGEVQGRTYESWLHACNWVKQSGNIPENARFLTPRSTASFRWNTGRGEVTNWKELPQDAPSIVDWFDRILHIFTYKDPNNNGRVTYYRSLAVALAFREQQPWDQPKRPPEAIEAEIRELADQYDFQYIICQRWPPIPLKRVYVNRHYAIYQVNPDDELVPENNRKPSPQNEAEPATR